MSPTTPPETNTTSPNPPATTRPRHPQQRGVSFSDDHVVDANDTVMPSKWTVEMEARLAAAQMELEKSQRRWSRGQEEWLGEVERLLETKKEYRRFVRRREKMMRKEGRRVKGPVAEGAAGGGGGSGTEDETSGGLSGLIRRVSSARSVSSVDSPARMTRANSMQSSGSEVERQSGRGFRKLFRRFSSKGPGGNS